MKKIVLFNAGKELTEQLNAYGEICNMEFKGFEDVVYFEQVQACLDQMPDLIIIDDDKHDSAMIVANIKHFVQVPVIYLSSDYSDAKRANWYTYGISDYALKPFCIQEIISKINIHLEYRDSLEHMYKDDNFRVNLIERTVNFRGEELSITNKEFDVLVYLLSNASHEVSRQDIILNLKCFDERTQERNIDTIVKRIRCITDKKIITTIRGVGYTYKV